MNRDLTRHNQVITRWLEVLLALPVVALVLVLLLNGGVRRTEAQSSSQQSANLVPNQGFEDPSPASWHNAGSSVGSLLLFWATGTAHTGDHSIGILSYESGSRGQWWSIPFAVRPGWNYRLSGWIRANSLSDYSFLTIAFYSSPSMENPVAEFRSSQVTGSSDWTEVTGNVIAPDSAYYARVYCELVGTGTAWFDDILVGSPTFYVYVPVASRDFYGFCNGGFETGDFSCWTHGGELSQSVVQEDASEGKYAALLGHSTYPCRDGVPIGEAWMKQTFSVPSCPSPMLSFMYRIFSYDKLTDDKWDSFDVYINGTLILRDGSPGPASCSHLWTSGWKNFAYDLSAYKEQNIQVSFHNVSRADHWYNTWTFVDQIGILCTP